MISVRKENSGRDLPKLSVILLDWSCRERFHALDWLDKQDAPRDQYELIWVELFERVIPEVAEKADVVITCGQEGLYHKHIGYNVGLLYARGTIVTVCDSDAVFPRGFVSSILRAFASHDALGSKSLVLMHYEYRTKEQYPDGLVSMDDLSTFVWEELWPNVGACMSITRADALRFGGFDEHESFRGYLCGPYDLGWRLVNAGVPEIWHDPSVAIWHFAHPDPVASFGQLFSWGRWREKAYPHVEHHALNAVEAFSSGRLLPLKENPEIHCLRMGQRQIGTEFERRYAEMRHLVHPSLWQRTKLRARFLAEPLVWCLLFLLRSSLRILRPWIGEQRYESLREWWLAKKRAAVKGKRAVEASES